MKKTPEETSRVIRCFKTGKKKSIHAQAVKEAKYLRYHKKYPGEIPQAYLCTGKDSCGWWQLGNRYDNLA